ncbi:MAG TPA: glycosyltransferase family 39 protein, partial [Pyrinomonadaceae bacterium]|nr:glycosyltransferase family 39 protein [Pyrinomonadaceae bacterium]
LFGLNTWSVRASVALFGVLTVLLVFALKRYIGKTGTLFAALFLALSPGMVFISRYFIHEILFVFFSLAIVVSMVYFLDRRKAGVFAIASIVLLLIICFLPSTLNIASMIGKRAPSLLWPARIMFAVIELALVGFVTRMLLAWNDGQPIYLLLASASMILLFATKETAFITIGTMVIAVCCVWGWQKLAGSEMFGNSKFGICTGATVVVTLAALAMSGQIKEGVSRLYDEFIPLKQATQTAVFYGIVVLVLTAVAAWVMYLVEIRRGENSSELDEPDSLTLGRLEERLQASSFVEIVIVKSGIMAIAVFVIWAFVRIGVAMIMSYGERGDAMIGWRKLDFENFDFVILAFGVFLAAVATIAYLVKRPAKLSADLILMIAASIVMFFYLGALFFSSFFTYPEGLQGAFKAYAIWTKTGNTDHTQNGFLAYVKWGMKLESPIMIISALGLLIALVRTRHRFGLFTGLWAFGLFAAYTIIPYKTPWLALSFLLPMAIGAGYALNEMLASRVASIRVAGMIAAAL